MAVHLKFLSLCILCSKSTWLRHKSLLVISSHWNPTKPQQYCSHWQNYKGNFKVTLQFWLPAKEMVWMINVVLFVTMPEFLLCDMKWNESIMERKWDHFWGKFSYVLYLYVCVMIAFFFLTPQRLFFLPCLGLDLFT